MIGIVSVSSIPSHVLGTGVSDPFAGYTVFDRFYDVDGTLASDHFPNKGSTYWSDQGGAAWEIRSGTARTVTAGAGNSDEFSLMETALSDGTMICDIQLGTINASASPHRNAGLCFRGAIGDTANWWLLWWDQDDSTWTLGKTVAGVYTQVATTELPAWGDTTAINTLKIVLSTNTIECLVNNSAIFGGALTDSDLDGATAHGLYNNNDSDDQYNDFGFSVSSGISSGV